MRATAQGLGGYKSHKHVANQSDYDSRVDPLIVYTDTNPQDTSYDALHEHGIPRASRETCTLGA